MGIYCSFCSNAQKGVDCDHYNWCSEVMFSKIPKEREKIEKFIKMYYKEKRPLFKIAQEIWEEKDPERIVEKQANYEGEKIKVIPVPDILFVPLKEVDEYMEKMKKKLEKILRNLD